MKKVVIPILFICTALMACSSNNDNKQSNEKIYIYNNYDLEKVLRDEYDPKRDVLKVFNLPYDVVAYKALDFPGIYKMGVLFDTKLPRFVIKRDNKLLYEFKGEINYKMRASHEFLKNTNIYHADFNIILFPIQGKEQTAVLVKPISLSYTEKYKELTTIRIPGKPPICRDVVLPPVPQIGAYAGIASKECIPGSGTPDTFTQKYIWKTRNMEGKASREEQEIMAVKLFNVIQKNNGSLKQQHRELKKTQKKYQKPMILAHWQYFKLDDHNKRIKLPENKSFYEQYEYFTFNSLQHYTGYAHVEYYNSYLPRWNGVQYNGWYVNGKEDSFGQFTFSLKNKEALYFIAHEQKNGEAFIKAAKVENGKLIVNGLFNNGEFLKPCYEECYQQNFVEKKKSLLAN